MESTKWLVGAEPEARLQASELLADVKNIVSRVQPVLLHQSITPLGVMVAVIIPPKDSQDMAEVARKLEEQFVVPDFPGVAAKQGDTTKDPAVGEVEPAPVSEVEAVAVEAVESPAESESPVELDSTVESADEEAQA